MYLLNLRVLLCKTGLLAGSNELIEIKCLAQCRVHSKGSIQGNYCFSFLQVSHVLDTSLGLNFFICDMRVTSSYFRWPAM